MITLDKVKNVKRDKDGRPWTWQHAGTIARFDTGDEAAKWLDEHILELDRNVVFFAGSTSLLNTLNSYLAKKQAEVFGDEQLATPTPDELIVRANIGVTSTEEGKQLVEAINNAMRVLLGKMQDNYNNMQFQEYQEKRYELKKARSKVQRDIMAIVKARKLGK